MMTRKDYVKVAAVLADAATRETRDDRPDDPGRAPIVAELAHDLAELMAADNPRFDRARFLAAAGVA